MKNYQHNNLNKKIKLFLEIHTWNPGYRSFTDSNGEISYRFFWGHTAIKMRLNTESEYFSFHPDYDISPESCCELVAQQWSKPATLKEENDELNDYGQPDSKVRLYKLDIDKVKEEIQRIRNNLDNENAPHKIKFGIGCNSDTCSSMINRLLTIGGLNENLPTSGKFTHPLHILLLSACPSTAIAAYSSLFYAFLAMRATPGTYYNAATFLTLSAIITTITLTDKYLATTNCLPGISPSLARQRKLIELSGADIAVKVITNIITALSGAAFRYADSQDLEIDQLAHYPVVDFALWSGVLIISHLGSGFLFSNLIYFFSGLKGVIRPEGFKLIAEYLEDYDALNSTNGKILSSLQTKKEYIMLTTFGVAAIISYLCRRILHDPEWSFLIGGNSGLIIGYGASKALITWLENKQKFIYENDNQHGKTYKRILEENDPKPGLVALTTGGALSGITLAINLTQDYYSKNPFINGSTALVAGFLGYLLGLYLYALLLKVNCCPQQNTNSFWSHNNPTYEMSDNYVPFHDEDSTESHTDTENNNNNLFN